MARIELAASQWLRAPYPAPEGFATTIRDALADLDARIQEALARLAPSAEVPEGDAAGALQSLLGQLRPVLAARGVRLDPFEATSAVWPVDARLARRSCMHLLREAANWTGPEGRLQLAAARSPEHQGLSLRAHAGATPRNTPERPFEESERFARTSGSRLTWEANAPLLEATLWFCEGTAR